LFRASSKAPVNIVLSAPFGAIDGIVSAEEQNNTVPLAGIACIAFWTAKREGWVFIHTLWDAPEKQQSIIANWRTNGASFLKCSARTRTGR
jgi:hypothetical protein